MKREVLYTFLILIVVYGLFCLGMRHYIGNAGAFGIFIPMACIAVVNALGKENKMLIDELERKVKCLEHELNDYKSQLLEG